MVCGRFNYDPSFAEHSGLLGYDPRAAAPALDTGVIAQEVRRVLPEAVREAGDVTLPNGDTIPKFLVVNKVQTSHRIAHYYKREGIQNRRT
jgi:myelin regulatory factor